MDTYKNLLLLVVGGTIVFFTLNFIEHDNSFFENKEVFLGVNTNKESIKKIKGVLEKLQDTTYNSPQNFSGVNKQLELISSNIQQLESNYNALSYELQSLKDQQEKEALALSRKKISPDFPSLNTPAVSFLDPDPLKKQEENITQQYENEWLSGTDDSIETTSIQSKLNELFSSSSNEQEEEVTVSNVECKTDSCKITLNYPDSMERLPVMTLMEQDDFSDKDIYFNKFEDPSSGQIEMTLYIKKSVENNNNDLPSSPVSIQ